MDKPGRSDSLATLRGRIGGLALSAQRDPREYTAAARAASPGGSTYWEKQVDPHGELLPAERRRRAKAAKRLHFMRLAHASAKARRGRRNGGNDKAREKSRAAHLPPDAEQEVSMTTIA